MNALIKEINAVKTELFCIFNADGSFKSSEIRKMINILYKKNSDFVLKFGNFNSLNILNFINKTFK